MYINTYTYTIHTNTYTIHTHSPTHTHAHTCTHTRTHTHTHIDAHTTVFSVHPCIQVAAQLYQKATAEDGNESNGWALLRYAIALERAGQLHVSIL